LLDEVREREHAYVADFGVTHVAFQEVGDEGLVGTVGYASPEQIRGEPIDARSDVYSLGCVLYECLTGRAPFVRRDALATMWAHLRDDPPTPSVVVPELPEELDTVIARAVAKEPGARYQTAGALADAARAALSAETPRHAPVDTLPTPPTAFFGREEELGEAAAALRASRLLTVVGAGGAGKTRLALEVARREASEHPTRVRVLSRLAPRPASSRRRSPVARRPRVASQTAHEALVAHLPAGESFSSSTTSSTSQALLNSSRRARRCSRLTARHKPRGAAPRRRANLRVAAALREDDRHLLRPRARRAGRDRGGDLRAPGRPAAGRGAGGGAGGQLPLPEAARPPVEPLDALAESARG
jgi:serine/threonine protein kinase